ncbi:hypothetical protein [Streptosporangium amethystogenes]|nr:hypothetical protein [Streptosporangium amethystogenes]
MAGVDEPVEQRFGDDGVGEQRIPVMGFAMIAMERPSAMRWEISS